MKFEIETTKEELALLKKYMNDFKAEWQSREIEKDIPLSHRTVLARINRNLIDGSYPGQFPIKSKTESAHILDVLQFQLITLHSSSTLSGVEELKEQVLRFIGKISEINADLACEVRGFKEMLDQ